MFRPRSVGYVFWDCELITFPIDLLCPCFLFSNATDSVSFPIFGPSASVSTLCTWTSTRTGTSCNLVDWLQILKGVTDLMLTCLICNSDSSCVQEVLKLMEKDDLLCNCSSACSEKSYDVDISSSSWPSNNYEVTLTSCLHYKWIFLDVGSRKIHRRSQGYRRLDIWKSSEN